MTPSPLRRVIELASYDGQVQTVRLECGHVFTHEEPQFPGQTTGASHVRCAACAAAARASLLDEAPRRRCDRRCARCGQIDIRPAYAPPPSACFRCRARSFVDF